MIKTISFSVCVLFAAPACLLAQSAAPFNNGVPMTTLAPATGSTNSPQPMAIELSSARGTAEPVQGFEGDRQVRLISARGDATQASSQVTLTNYQTGEVQNYAQTQSYVTDDNVSADNNTLRATTYDPNCPEQAAQRAAEQTTVRRAEVPQTVYHSGAQPIVTSPQVTTQQTYRV